MIIKTDSYCPICKGSGVLSESIGPYNETYTISMECYCVEYEHTEAEKKMLQRLTGRGSC